MNMATLNSGLKKLYKDIFGGEEEHKHTLPSSIQELLLTLGFPEYHSKILLYLWETQKHVDAKQIETNTKVPLSRIYSVMLNLKKNNLIQVMPGKINLYKTLSKEKLIEAIKSYKDSQLKEQKQSIDEACNLLNQKLSSKASSEQVNITYYHDNASYWKDYLRTERKLKKGEIHRIINNIRLCASFVKEEHEQMSLEQAKVMRGEGLGEETEIWIVNPASFVNQVIKDLPDLNLAKKALRQVLNEFKEQASEVYLSEDTSRILVAINPYEVYMEFYGEDSRKILSAIRIESKDIARDFAKWFDVLAKSCKKKGYLEFEKEIVKLAKQHKISL